MNVINKLFCKSHACSPIISIIVFGTSLIACYVIALTNGHVEPTPFVPMISYTGLEAPESCIFTLTLTWISIFFIAFILGYYDYVKVVGQHTKLNNAAVGIGFVASCGLTVAGSFQLSKVKAVHLTGAVIAYIGCIAYTWLIVVINVRNFSTLQKPFKVKRWMIVLRITLSSIMTICLMLGFILVYVQSKRTGKKKKLIMSIASVFEWIITYLLFVFVATMSYESRNFKSLRLGVVCDV